MAATTFLSAKYCPTCGWRERYSKTGKCAGCCRRRDKAKREAEKAARTPPVTISSLTDALTRAFRAGVVPLSGWPTLRDFDERYQPRLERVKTTIPGACRIPPDRLWRLTVDAADRVRDERRRRYVSGLGYLSDL